MVTVRERINQFLTLLAPKMSDDTNLPTYDEVYNYLLQARSTYIRQEMSNKREIPQSMIQSINCIELEEVSQAQCGLSAPSGCIWQRSTKKIPTFLKIDKIINSDNSITYDLIGFDRAKGVKNLRIPSARKGKYAAIKDDYLYVLNSKFLKEINIYGVIEDPILGPAYHNPLVLKCNPYDEDFFTTEQYFDIILKMSLDIYTRIMPAQEKDTLNNDRQDSDFRLA